MSQLFRIILVVFASTLSAVGLLVCVLAAGAMLRAGNVSAFEAFLLVAFCPVFVSAYLAVRGLVHNQPRVGTAEKASALLLVIWTPLLIMAFLLWYQFATLLGW